MNIVLDSIKPKRLVENKFAILNKDYIILDLEDTLVYASCKTQCPLSIISIKDLYSNNLDECIPLEKYEIPFDIKSIETMTFEEILINVNDSTYFSSISAAGEDLFFCGSLDFTKETLTFSSYGLLYGAIYKSHKSEFRNPFNFYIDYHVFYYLFQMFKNLSGKKTDSLLVSRKNNLLFLTNKEKEFYIICKQPNIFKSSGFETIKKYYSELTYQERVLQIIKKDWIQDKDSFIKHLIRPLSDTPSLKASQNTLQLSSDNYILHINKEK